MKTINSVKGFGSKENDYSLLVFGIIRQAINDFKQYFIQLKKQMRKSNSNWLKIKYYQDEILNVIKFFRSEYYYCLSDINGEVILKQLVKEMMVYKKEMPEFKDFINKMIEYAS